MNRWLRLIAVLAMSSLFLTACWPTPKTGPKTGSGSPIVMYVLVDAAIEKSFNDYQVRNRRQTADFMEKDMAKMLEKAGYAPKIIARRSEYKAGPGSYLLSVKITHYNPGVKAVRMYVGYGAGAASMETHYELYGRGQKPLLSNDKGAGTGSAWEKAIRKIDVMTINEVSEKLGGKGE